MEIDQQNAINQRRLHTGFKRPEDVNNRQQKTALKVQSISGLKAASLPKCQPEPLAGRVDKTPPGASIQLSPSEQLMQMDPEELCAIDNELGKLQNKPPSYYYNVLQEVIAKILSLYIKMADNDRLRKDTQQNKYNHANKQWGKYQTEIGTRGMNFTWGTLGVMAIGLLVPESDKPFISYLAKEGLTNISNMLNTDTQSQQKMADALAQLMMAEMNAAMNKGSSDASSKQEFSAVLDKLHQLHQRAAQAAG